MKNLLFALLFCSSCATAQTIFLSSGTIEFERSINIHKQVDPDDEDSWLRNMLSKLPNFYSATFYLDFDSSHTLYRPSPDNTDFVEKWIIGPAKGNTVFTDFKSDTRQSAKSVFEANYLIHDSASPIGWKISDETREIAGFSCRKAVGRICDSVYVTAFYTDEIMVSGGPESFNGLPGMILGLAVPRLHTTWFAKKVVNTPPKTSLHMTAKGKAIGAQELTTLLKKSMSDWGTRGNRNVWWTTL